MDSCPRKGLVIDAFVKPVGTGSKHVMQLYCIARCWPSIRCSPPSAAPGVPKLLEMMGHAGWELPSHPDALPTPHQPINKSRAYELLLLSFVIVVGHHKPFP